MRMFECWNIEQNVASAATTIAASAVSPMPSTSAKLPTSAQPIMSNGWK